MHDNKQLHLYFITFGGLNTPVVMYSHMCSSHFTSTYVFIIIYCFMLRFLSWETNPDAMMKKDTVCHRTYHVAVGAEGIWMGTFAGFTSTVRAEVPVVGGALVTVVANDVWLAGALASPFITVTHSISTVVVYSACSYTSTACRTRQSAELNINA